MAFRTIKSEIAILIILFCAGFLSLSEETSPISGNFRPEDLPPIPPGKNCIDHNDGNMIILNCDQTIFYLADSFALKGEPEFYDPYKGLVIHTTELTINGDFQMPSQNIFLITETLQLSGHVTFNLSGEVGPYDCQGCTPPGIPTSEGTNGVSGYDGSRGGNGGDFVLVLATDQITCDVEPCLTIVTNGARGGNGQGGGDGSVGNQGKAGSFGQNGGDGGQGGDGGKPGSGGDGGNGGEIYIYTDNPKSNKWINFTSLAGDVGRAGTGGQPGQGGLGGGGGSYRHCHSCWGVGHCCKNKCCKPSGHTGPVGNPAPFPDENPVPGTPGTITVGNVNTTILNKYVTDEQLELSLTFAEDLYLNNNFKASRDHLMWIIYIINGHNISLSHPCENAEEDSQCLNTYHNNSLRYSIANLASSYLTNMKQGRNLNGEFFNDCPALNTGYYYDKSKFDIESTKKIEDEYRLFISENNTMTVKLNAVTAGLVHTKLLMADLDNQIKKNDQQVLSESQIINKLSIQSQNLQLKVTTEEGKCIEAIEKKMEHDLLGMVFGDLFKLAQTVLDFATMSKSAFTDLKTLLKSFKSLKDGFKDLDTLIKDMHTIADDVGSEIKDIKNLVNKYKDIKSQIDAIGKQDSQKIALNIQNFDNFIKKYLDISECAHLKDLFHQLLTVIHSRNDHVLTHDKSVLTTYSLTSKKKLLQVQYQKAQSQLVDTYNPYTAEMSSYMKKILKTMMRNSIRTLSNYNQALKCHYYVPSEIALSAKNTATLYFALDSISTSETKAIEQASFNTNSFHYHQVSVHLNNDTHPHQLQSFHQTKHFNFSLPITHDSFAGFANVKVNQFSVCVYPVQSFPVKLILSHPGTQVGVTPRGTYLNFNFRHRTYMFIVDANSCQNGSVPEMKLQSDYEKELKKNIAPISPFSLWNIEIPQNLNPQLNHSKITGFEIFFQGTYQPLAYPQKAPYVFGGKYNSDTQESIHETKEESNTIDKRAFYAYLIVLPIGGLFSIILFALGLVKFVKNKRKARRQLNLDLISHEIEGNNITEKLLNSTDTQEQNSDSDIGSKTSNELDEVINNNSILDSSTTSQSD
ncbi:collagen type xviii alpha 1 chain a [Anaeramoeba flamelloides]|uniref:Collagen type xviii alpha 1 chain a n=1 Tax=Anaeramoeba flamelloides TaxID=1746091 RepID=A0ABQ8X125_9EUKA|nr:collagen type xviii alpha 1 chain a [Anaeramoeba flamelloides]